MNVEISYHAQVRLAAGRASEPVEMAAGATLSTLLAALADRYAPAFRQFVVNNTNRPRPGIIVLVNDRPLAPGADPALAEGDRVFLFSPVAGG